MFANKMFNRSRIDKTFENSDRNDTGHFETQVMTDWEIKHIVMCLRCINHRVSCRVLSFWGLSTDIAHVMIVTWCYLQKMITCCDFIHFIFTIVLMNMFLAVVFFFFKKRSTLLDAPFFKSYDFQAHDNDFYNWQNSSYSKLCNLMSVTLFFGKKKTWWVQFLTQKNVILGQTLG